MAEQQLPPALAGDERFVWLNELLSENIQQLDLNAMLVYLVDLVKPELLPILAEQFSMLEEPAWPAARSNDDRRALIKTAIELHRYKGTPWAVKQALAIIGYPVLELIEYEGYQRDWTAAGGYVLDGTWQLDGSVKLDAPVHEGRALRLLNLNHWAQYAIRLDVTNADWTLQQQKRIRQVAIAYAPARSELASIIATMTLKFTARPLMRLRAARVRGNITGCHRFQPADRLTLSGCWALTEFYQDLLLDGTWQLDGSQQLNGLKTVGLPLAQGQIAIRHKVRMRLRLSTGGQRSEDPGQLDGSRQLDGTWQLGGDLPGPAGGWFSAVLRSTKNGVTTQEPL